MDGQTDMMKLTVAFRNFANVPKKGRTTSRSVLQIVCHYTKHTPHPPLINSKASEVFKIDNKASEPCLTLNVLQRLSLSFRRSRWSLVTEGSNSRNSWETMECHVQTKT